MILSLPGWVAAKIVKNINSSIREKGLKKRKEKKES